VFAMSIWKTFAQDNPGKASEGLWSTPVEKATGAGELRIAFSCLNLSHLDLVLLHNDAGICCMLLTQQT